MVAPFCCYKISRNNQKLILQIFSSRNMNIKFHNIRCQHQANCEYKIVEIFKIIYLLSELEGPMSSVEFLTNCFCFLQILQINKQLSRLYVVIFNFSKERRELPEEKFMFRKKIRNCSLFSSQCLIDFKIRKTV